MADEKAVLLPLVLSLVLCEPVCWGLEHAIFNAALVETFQAAYPTAQLHFYGEAKHLDFVRAALSEATSPRIIWHPITIPPRHLYSFFKRLPQEWKLWKQMLQTTTKLQAPVLTACSGTAESIFVLKVLLSLSLYKDQGTLIFLHSVLGNLTRKRRNPLARIISLARVLSTANRRNLHYVVLSDSIKIEAERLLPPIRNYLEALPFPYQFYRHETKTINAAPPLRFAFMGVGSQEKGFAWFVQLARDIHAQYPQRAEFYLIGELHMNLTAEESQHIITHSAGGMLPREKFDDLATTMHYSLMLHDPEFYRLIASASVLDALLHGLPIIARRSTAMESYFQVMGNIGYLVDDYTQLHNQVVAIIENPPVEEYRKQSANMLKMRQQFSPLSVALHLKAIVDSWVQHHAR
ncbi:MAG: glycosyltransferase [Abitibacteriaceae bacterium]|nr:glycosyltransferase [Abditibacteriaceae bacterium]MBV9864097.1 glycosyltransferase [Abditibacteriaceae bacterium]